MNQSLRKWWEESAQKIFSTCIDHSRERVQALQDYAKSIKNATEKDGVLIKDFYSDTHAIGKHIKTLKNPLLKLKEKLFVISLKNYIFDFGVKVCTLSKIEDEVYNLIKKYKNIETQLLQIKSRFEVDDNTLDESIIEKSANLVASIQKFDEACEELEDIQIDVSAQRNEILDEFEDFLITGSKEMAEAEMEEFE